MEIHAGRLAKKLTKEAEKGGLFTLRENEKVFILDEKETEQVIIEYFKNPN
jgi:hypothetical protein